MMIEILKMVIHVLMFMILINIQYITCTKRDSKKYSFDIRSVVGDPDGYPRPVIIVHNKTNGEPRWDRQRPFPAPLIRASKGDELEISFTNMLFDQSTSIHFHGLHMSNNPWMDGVDMITQCPVYAGETFTYKFNLTQSGTFWYHSHAYQQYADGLVGPIVIDPSPGEQDPIFERFPYDHKSDYVIMLQEWYHETWQDIVVGYRSFHNSSRNYQPRYPMPPTSLLINGHGRFDCHTTNCNITQGNPSEPTFCNHPKLCIPLRDSYFGSCRTTAHNLDEFLCHNGKYVRLRLINAASSIPLRFWIDQHPLIIVARDSLPVEPYEKSYIAIPVGQRLDVIVRCNQNTNFKYNMYVAVPGNFITGINPDNWMNALFVYSNSTTISPPQMTPQSNFTDDVLFEYKHLRPLNASNQTSPPAVKRLIYSFSALVNDTDEDAYEEWQINNKTFISPTHQPLLQSIYFDHDVSLALPTPKLGRLGNSYETFIEYLEIGEVYEVLIINNDPRQHPFHLHGYSVDFLAAGTHKNLTNIYYDECNLTKFDMNKVDYNRILPSYSKPMEILSTGDTFTVPRKGFVLFRFKADNPGPWFFHCHMEWHIAPGLGLVFSAGKEQGHSYANLLPPPSVTEFLMCSDTKQRWGEFYSSKSPILTPNYLIPFQLSIPLVISYAIYSP
jgi:FtsP/CotA-like multicopper oxidase with cupredoxin domain